MRKAPADSDRWLRAREVAEMIGITERTVWSWVAQGKLKPKRFTTRTVRFERKALEAMRVEN